MFERLFGRREKEREEPKVVTPSPDTRTTPIDTERLEAQLGRLNQQILGLMERAGTLQEQLERVDHRTSFGNDQLETLVQHLSDVAGWAGPLDTRLAELVTWAEQSHEELTQLEEGIRKLSRTQFKANSLAEAQQERLQTALETLQDLATRKQEEAEKARQQQREAVEVAQREARVAMVIDLFPALDGLEAALESGRALLERSRRPAPKPGFLARLAYAFGLLDLPQAGGGDAHALAAWLDGLELVRERFLALLQTEGIQPIRAEGRPFDPHRHVAVEAVERPDVPPGTVVEEHRPGYRLGDQVLRYAEVVVNRNGLFVDEPEKSEEPEGEGPIKAWEPVVEEPEELEWMWEPEAFEEPEEPAGIWKPEEPEEPESVSERRSDRSLTEPGGTVRRPAPATSETRSGRSLTGPGGTVRRPAPATFQRPAPATFQTGSEEPEETVVSAAQDRPEPGGTVRRPAPATFQTGSEEPEETVVSAAQDRPFDEAQARPFDEAPRPEQQEPQGVPFNEALRQTQEEPQARPFDEALRQAQEEPQDRLFDEAPQALDEPAGEMEKDTSPETARRTVDPEIEKMIARFEERRRARRS